MTADGVQLQLEGRKVNSGENNPSSKHRGDVGPWHTSSLGQGRDHVVADENRTSDVVDLVA